MQDVKTLTIAVLAALLLVVSPAQTDDRSAADAPPAQTGKKNRPEWKIADAAVRAAAEEAARSLLEKTRLDLDIRLIGPTSPTIAGHK